jgi:type I restriction enzyme S subunit
VANTLEQPGAHITHGAWREYRLGDLFEERNETNRPDLPLLSITADSGVVHRNEIERPDYSNPDKSKYLRICPGDIGYNTMRMWQGVSARSSLEGIVSPAYTVCMPNELIDAHYAAALFKHPAVVHLFRRYSQGLVDDTLALKFHNFAQIRVRIPPLEEQRSLVEVFQAIDRELRVARDFLKALTVQKRALFHRLLEGEMRLPSP